MLAFDIRRRVTLAPWRQVARHVPYAGSQLEHPLADVGHQCFRHPLVEPVAFGENVEYLLVVTLVNVAAQGVPQYHVDHLQGIAQAYFLALFVGSAVITDRDLVNTRLPARHFDRQLGIDAEPITAQRYASEQGCPEQFIARLDRKSTRLNSS